MMAARLLPGLLLLCLLGAVCAKVANPQLTDKVVELIRKKAYDKFTDELQQDGMDANQPDSKGRLPLVEAVRTKDVRYVDALIQYGALAKSKDPATGATPIHIAFQQNLKEIARLLLSYGADINVSDKSGKKAREFAPSQEIRQLILDYDRDGAMAFEDEPGTWVKESKDSKHHYWFNSKTNDSRWNTPPSCAWQRVEIQGHPVKYINAVTGQEVFKTPGVLAWAKVRADGNEVYYNWHANFSQLERPDEVPVDLLAKIEENINVRWYNEKTEQFSWEDPKYHTTWRELTEEGGEGKTYYFNVESGQSVWEMPDELAWTRQDDEKGGAFYFNRITGESTWDAPDHMAWSRHDSDL